MSNQVVSKEAYVTQAARMLRAMGLSALEAETAAEGVYRAGSESTAPRDLDCNCGLDHKATAAALKKVFEEHSANRLMSQLSLPRNAEASTANRPSTRWTAKPRTLKPLDVLLSDILSGEPLTTPETPKASRQAGGEGRPCLGQITIWTAKRGDFEEEFGALIGELERVGYEVKHLNSINVFFNVRLPDGRWIKDSGAYRDLQQLVFDADERAATAAASKTGEALIANEVNVDQASKTIEREGDSSSERLFRRLFGSRTESPFKKFSDLDIKGYDTGSAPEQTAAEAPAREPAAESGERQDSSKGYDPMIEI